MPPPLKDERQERILETIRDNHRVTVAELSDRFDVSHVTIRRDLQEMAEQGMLRRTHGGAIISHHVRPEPPVVQRMHETELLDELQRLAPAECLLADRRGELFDAETRRLAKDIGQLTRAIVTERPGWYFDPYQAKQRLLKHFGAATLEGFGIADGDQDLVPPAGAVIEYLNEKYADVYGL